MGHRVEGTGWRRGVAEGVRLMRMAGAVTLGIIIIEALLAGAFLLGLLWLDAWYWGVLFAGALLVLIALPWLGELKLVFDSAGPRGAVKVGWWGKASFAVGETATRVVIRILGIPIRRRMERKQPEAAEEPAETEAPPEFEPAAAEGMAEESAPTPTEEEPETVARRKSVWQRVDSETMEGFCRIIGSGLGATCELVWGAEEIRVLVTDPAEKEIADRVLEQVFGRREVGPADLSICSGDGTRRVRAVYRIGLLRAALAGLQVVIDGRVLRFMRRMKSQDEGVGVTDEDERMIEQIIEQSGSREEDDD